MKPAGASVGATESPSHVSALTTDQNHNEWTARETLPLDPGRSTVLDKRF